MAALINGVPRDKTAANSSGDGSKNTNAGTDPDLFMNTSREDCNEEQDGPTNPHILSESESDERDMDTIPPPNPPNKLPNGSEPAHGTGFNDTAQDKNAIAGGTAAPVESSRRYARRRSRPDRSRRRHARRHRHRRCRRRRPLS